MMAGRFLSETQCPLWLVLLKPSTTEDTKFHRGKSFNATPLVGTKRGVAQWLPGFCSCGQPRVLQPYKGPQKLILGVQTAPIPLQQRCPASAQDRGSKKPRACRKPEGKPAL